MADLGRLVSKSSTAFKLALIGLLATLVVHIVGYATNNWMRVGSRAVSVKRGLWKDCVCWNYLGSEQCICTSVPVGTGWSIDTARALESIGLAGILLTLLFSIAGAIITEGKTWKNISIIAAFLSCLVIIVGIIIYAVAVASGYLHFSFALCTLAGCGMFVCACLLVADRNTRPRPEGGTVIQYNSQNQIATVPPAYGNQGHYVGTYYQPGVQPPPYGQGQYYPGYTVNTVTQGQSSYMQPSHTDPPPGYK